MYIRELPKNEQIMIECRIRRELIQLGITGDDLREMITDALDSKVSDVDDLLHQR